MASLSPLPARSTRRARSGTIRPAAPVRRAPERPGVGSGGASSPSSTCSAASSLSASPSWHADVRASLAPPPAAASGSSPRPSSSSRFARLPPSLALSAHLLLHAPDAAPAKASPTRTRRTSALSSSPSGGGGGAAEDSASETENEGFEDAQSVDVDAEAELDADEAGSNGMPSSANSAASGLSDLGAGPRAPSGGKGAAAQRKKDRRVSLAAELALADSSTEEAAKQEKEEREEEEQVRLDMADLDLSKLPPPPSQADEDDEEGGAPAAAAAARPAQPSRLASLSPLEGRRSLWDRLRSASGETPPAGAAGSGSSTPSNAGAGAGAVASPTASPSLASPAGAAARPAPAKRPTFGALPSFSSLAAAAAAGLGAAGRRGSGPTEESAERQRLPRFGVDETQLAQDAMRFIDARDVLYNEKDPAKIRELGMRLEAGWREKLQEISQLHSKLEAAQHALSDVEDENATLRTSISALSEQVASLEAAFDSFQHATIEQMRRERELWDEERKEELERVLYDAASARREAEAAKVVVAQLRLVLLGAGMKGDVDVQAIERAIETLSRGVPSDVDEPSSASTSGETTEQDAEARRMSSAMLFDIPMSPGGESRRQSMLFSEPVSLTHLRLLGLAPPEASGTPSSPSSSVHTDRTSLASLPATPLSSSNSQAAALETLAKRKEAADESLARALREENERLRTQMKERERKLAAANKEVESLKERVRDTEAAVEGLFAAV